MGASRANRLLRRFWSCGLVPALALAATAGFPGIAAARASAQSGVSPEVAASSGLHVVPAPGTPDASPESEIIFSSLKPADLRSLSVQGSQSGLHSGRLTLLPDNAGTAFLADRRFEPGERVQVAAALTSSRAGTASGDPGATELRFWFQVAVPASTPVPVPGTGISSADATVASSANEPRGSFSFHTLPGFRPPVFSISTDDDPASGDIFLTPNHTFQRGPMILDGHGRLVWFQPTRGGAAYNLEVQRYHGQPVLTWWQGAVDLIADQHYRVIATVRAQDGYVADVHEFQVTPQGTALIDVYSPVHENLTRYGGPANGTVMDCIIQELDIKTGRLLWEWHALAHIPPNESYTGPSSRATWDPYHLNTIQQLPSGNLLISTRNTWGVYWIKPSTSKIVWSLGGKHSSFKLGPGARFEWQHDSHLLGNTVTVFDDADAPQEEAQSSGKQLKLNTQTMTATLVHRYTHTPPELAGAAGSVQTLPDHNVFIGWGTDSSFSEYNPQGRQVLDGNFAIGVYSYRAYRFPWVGQPLTAPATADVTSPSGSVTVFASWNGATQVAAWRVRAGPTITGKHWYARVPWTGLETAITLRSEPRYFVVQALDAAGKVIGTSPNRPVTAHVAIFTSNAFVSSPQGYGSVPVGCFTGHDCRFTLTVTSGRSVLARATSRPVPPASGRLIYFTLSAAGRRKLDHAPSNGLPVRVSIRDSSGAKASVKMTLVPFSTTGRISPQPFSQARSLQIARTDAFVAGRGVEVLAACYATPPCRIQGEISVGGKVIASTPQVQPLGTNELGYVPLQLNQTGQSMVAADSGNQLPAQLKLRNGATTARGQVDLIRYQ